MDRPAAPRGLVPVLVLLCTVVRSSAASAPRWCPRSRPSTTSSLGTAQWSLTITLLVGAVATPTMGRLADGPRRRTVVLVALALVVVG